MIKILKKNGEVQSFNGDKIKKAIRKSATRVCIELTDKEENKLVTNVKSKLKDYTEPVPVNTVHNMVETQLDDINPRIAKSYREYRDNKSYFSSMLEKVYCKKLSLSFVGDRSNANSDSALVTTQKAIVYNELNSELYKRFFLTQKEEKAMSDGYIYIHDRGSRLDCVNCCLFDMKNVITGGFYMGNLDYLEPKTLDVAFDLVADVTLNAASSQYGGFTICEVDKLFEPYAQKSFKLYLEDFLSIKGYKDTDTLETIKISDYNAGIEYAKKKVQRDFEQGFQSWEMKFNSVASSRGDYPFTAITFGLGTSVFETMCSSAAMKVRKEGQGKPGFKHPVLFPKLSFFYDENLHGSGKELEWLFDEAIECSAKTMYPDFISCTGDGYAPSIYKKYGVTISRMGCRANLSPWYERGGMEPADDDDKPVYVGRFNLGAISLHFSMIAAKAKKENRDFFEVLLEYMQMIREIHLRTFDYISHKKAGTNPLGFCQGGFLNGYKDPEEELGEDFLKPMTLSFGIMGLNEASVFVTGKTINEDNSWAIKVMDFINDTVNRWKKEDGKLYAIYGTPGESLCHTQIIQFRKKYGIIKGVSDHEYTTNSFHCPVYADITPIEKQDIEYPLFHRCNGGNIQYCKITDGKNLKAIKDLTKRAMKMGFYYGNNQDLNYCQSCGKEFSGEVEECPECGSKNMVSLRRMCGYLGLSNIRGKTMFNDAKMAEFKERVSM